MTMIVPPPPPPKRSRYRIKETEYPDGKKLFVIEQRSRFGKWYSDGEYFEGQYDTLAEAQAHVRRLLEEEYYYSKTKERYHYDL